MRKNATNPSTDTPADHLDTTMTSEGDEENTSQADQGTQFDDDEEIVDGNQAETRTTGGDDQVEAQAENEFRFEDYVEDY
ncbi:hypothetical protein N7494_002670 [Penicillium frequentans]|uniref:Uncharacterized protein n=1 Tax=Penicillium frequentans TaxID=3151616 RepID=A0AAD6D441_9EURO|nr:hypothetical protein N7494_002670 [Penicillium glabrum]